MNMRFQLYSLACLLVTFIGTANAQNACFQSTGDIAGFSLSVETVATDVVGGQTTYRVYLTTPSTDDFVSAVIGDDDTPLFLNTTTSFYQDALGGTSPSAISPLLYGTFPDLAYDSWVTIGSENQIDNAMIDIGIDWTEFENGGNIETDNGIWFSIPNDMQGFAGDDLRVLIGQFTTFGWDSQIYGSINLQGRQGDFESFVARDQYFGWVPAPATMVLFGLVFFKSRRRH